MKKEGHRSFINSQDGKVKIALLFSIALIFLLTMLYAEAFSIKLFAPGNFTSNSTGNQSLSATASYNRNIFFYFNYSRDIALGANPSGQNTTNCSLFLNSTTASG